MQRWYRVGGDYGPQGGDYIEFHVLTSLGPKNACNLFALRIQRDYPWLWERMGLGNIEAFLVEK